MNTTAEYVSREKTRLRVEFAKAAMQGLLAQHMTMSGGELEAVYDDSIAVPDEVATRAVKIADALLAELSKPS